MTFTWPPALLLVLAAIPLGILAYRLVERRQRHRVGRIRRPGPGPGASLDAALRDRVPPLLFVVGLTVLTVALARPQGMVEPAEAGGDGHPRVRRVGQHGRDRPRADPHGRGQGGREELRGAPAGERGDRRRRLQRLGRRGPAAEQRPGHGPRRDRPPGTPQAGRRSGSGILASLDAIATAPAAGPNVDYYSNRSPAPTPSPTPVPAGTHAPAVIVLLTDGENNESPDPLAAAQAAADRGVRIYTVGIGSAAGHDPRSQRLPGPHAARRGDAPADRRRSPAGPTTRADDAAEPQVDLRQPRHAAHRPAGADRAHGALRRGRHPAPGAGCGRLARLAGAPAVTRRMETRRTRRRPVDVVPVARPAARARRSSRSSSPSTPGASAGDGRRGSATPAWRSSARPGPDRGRLRRHLPFALFAARASPPRRRPRPADRDRQRPGQRDDDHPDHRRLGQHVLERHRADAPAGRRGGRRGVHRAPGARRRRSGSWPSAASPRWSRHRPTTSRRSSARSAA